VALAWYRIHVDRLLGSGRWRAATGDEKGLWMNLTLLAAATAEGRKTGRIVRPNGSLITVAEIREEFGYPRVARVRRMVDRLVEIGLVAGEPDVEPLRIPRFAKLQRPAGPRYKQNTEVSENRPRTIRETNATIVTGQGVRIGSRDLEAEAESVDSQSVGSTASAREPTPAGTAAGSRPNLRRIRPNDLTDLGRLLALREQAPVGFPRGERGELLWVACAVRAVRVADDPPRFFRSLVDPKRGGWRAISGADDDAAARALREYRRGERSELCISKRD
jgi:hypothetical protein